MGGKVFEIHGLVGGNCEKRNWSFSIQNQINFNDGSVIKRTIESAMYIHAMLCHVYIFLGSSSALHMSSISYVYVPSLLSLTPTSLIYLSTYT